MDTNLFQIMFVDEGVLFPSVGVTPRLVLAQAVHESANFNSHVFQANNNCLGMMAPDWRPTTCTNKGSGTYAKYENVLDGIKDYYYWCQNRGIKTDADLLACIKKPASAGGYAADPKYAAKVLQQVALLDKGNKYLNPAIIKTGSVAVLGVALAAAAVAVVELVGHD